MRDSNSHTLADEPPSKRWQCQLCLILHYGGGGGIRTHVPRRANGFQDRLVMAASILLHNITAFRTVCYTRHMLSFSLTPRFIRYLRKVTLLTPKEFRNGVSTFLRAYPHLMSRHSCTTAGGGGEIRTLAPCYRPNALAVRPLRPT